MRVFLIIWILISLVFIWVSYETEESNDFYDIKGLNSDLKRKLDIDLLEIKKNTDSVHEVYKNFYDDFLKAPYESFSTDYFELANIPFDLVNSNGLNLSETKDSDSLAKIMMLSLADNLKDDNCSRKSTDSLCIYKLELKRILQERNPMEEQTSYMYFTSLLKPLMDRDYLSEEELNYLILYNHYLVTLIGE
ncbi:MAG: hypothetical protein COA32_15160 [Fluviicola sp.]|nr:MAG: hypothetical protein COA32_15160 [Fluviicola sp.]